MDNRDGQMKKIAASIALLRQQAGMTQADLAERLMYSPKAVSKWEHAESLPDVFVLKQIADIFGVTVDGLFEPETVCAAAAQSAGADAAGEVDAEDEVRRAEEKLSELRLYPHGRTDIGNMHIPMTPKHLCITALGCMCVWFLAVAAYVILRLFGVEGGCWLAYVAAVPVNAIVLLIFNTLWGRRVNNQAIISVIVWTVLAFLYLLLLTEWGINAWLLFLIGVPLSAALPVWNFLERQAEKKRLKKMQ